MIEHLKTVTLSYLEINRFSPHSENIIVEPIPELEFGFGIFEKTKKKKNRNKKFYSIDYYMYKDLSKTTQFFLI